MATIDDVFARMAMLYGTRFTSHWKPEQVPAVKAAWALELKGLPPEALDFGLANLPAGNPPMAIEFRDSCLKFAANKGFAKPRPLTPAEQERGASILRAWSRPGGQAGPRDWAVQLRDKEQAGEQLSAYQRSAWRAALHSPKESET